MAVDVLAPLRGLGLGAVLVAAYSLGNALSAAGGRLPVAQIESTLLVAAAAVPLITVATAYIVGQRARRRARTTGPSGG